MVKIKDNWSQLSIKQRADLIRLYTNNGITDLKQIRKHYNGIPYKDLNTSDYDYFGAAPDMAPTNENEHWGSRNPYTGQLLKGENHPTRDLMLEGEKNAGYTVIRGYDGLEYSITEEPSNYVEEPNKYGWGGASKEALGKAFGDASSTVGSVGNIAGSAMTMVSNGMENAEINTTEADNAIEAVKSYKLDNSSLDALANSYNSTPWAATDYDSSDFTKSGWEIAGNTFESTLSGITTGASIGGPWGAVIGGLAGLGSGLIGWGIGESKAEEAERRLEAEAKKANRAIELNAVNTRDSILQQQANNTLRNIAADGGRLNNFDIGGYTDGWDKIDNFVEKVEPYVSGASLASMGATLAFPNPVTGAVAVGTNGLGVLIDGYQALRGLAEKDYKKAVKNGVEAGLSLFGGKAVKALAKTKAGKVIGKIKQSEVDKRVADVGEKTIVKLMKKGLSEEQAANIALGNAINFVENSNKVKDVIKGVEDNYKKKAESINTIGSVIEDGVDVVDSVIENVDWNPLEEIRPSVIVGKKSNGGRLNKFGPGGEKESIVKKSKPGNWIQRLAYKFGSDPKVSAKGIASKEDIIRILKSSEDIDWDVLDNNKATYLFGNILGLFPAGETKGKDYSNYLKENYPLKYILGKIKEYEGTINPFNEYVIDSRDKGLVEELAKKGKGLYSNSDIEYSYMFDAYDTPPYKEDVANYHMQFVNTPNGISVSASDLYDFGKDYNPEDYNDSGNNSYNNLLTDIEVAAFTAAGNPFVYRQENIPIRFIDTNNNMDEEGTRASELSRAWNWANLSDEDLEKGISFDEKLANILDTGYIEPAVVTAEAKSKGGKLNIFGDGGYSTNPEKLIWERAYGDLPKSFKQAILKVARELNYEDKDVEKAYNSGELKAALDAVFKHAPYARVRNNDSPTSEESSKREDKMNSLVYNKPNERVSPNMKFAIPYIEDLEIKIPGVGRTTTNALDSLAKYAFEAKIPLEEALGLGAQETALGALPFYNYVEIPKNGTEEEKQKARDHNRALGNSSYFRNYGIIPAENLVRDFRYNIVEDPISRDVPPLLHAFNYWKEGMYNRGDKNHTSDVRERGREVMSTKPIQEWINNSKYAQKAINLFK